MSLLLPRSLLRPLAIFTFSTLVGCTAAPLDTGDDDEDSEEDAPPRDAGKKDGGTGKQDAGAGKQDAGAAAKKDAGSGKDPGVGTATDASTAGTSKKDAGAPESDGGVDDSTEPGLDGGVIASRDGSVSTGEPTKADAASGEPDNTPGAPTTPVKCGDPKLLFCEDFEAQAVGDAKANDKWKPVQAGASLKISDAAPMHTSKALHIGSTNSSDATIEIPFTPPGNSYFGRMNAYVSALPVTAPWAHWVLVEMGGTGNSEALRPVGGQYVADSKSNFFGPGSFGGATGDWTNWDPQSPFAAGQWVCIEWEMRDGAEPALNIWIDGEEKPGANVTSKKPGANGFKSGNLTFPKFTSAKVGWTLFQQDSAMVNLYLDDIAFSSERIGCAK